MTIAQSLIALPVLVKNLFHQSGSASLIGVASYLECVKVSARSDKEGKVSIGFLTTEMHFCALNLSEPIGDYIGQ